MSADRRLLADPGHELGEAYPAVSFQDPHAKVVKDPTVKTPSVFR